MDAPFPDLWPFDHSGIRAHLRAAGHQGELGLPLLFLLSADWRDRWRGTIVSFPDDDKAWKDGEGRPRGVAYVYDGIARHIGFVPMARSLFGGSVRQLTFVRVGH